MDDVLTHAAYRARGPARVLTQHLVACHDGLPPNGLYLSAENPTAIRIYRKAGFVQRPLDVDLWDAWLGADDGP